MNNFIINVLSFYCRREVQKHSFSTQQHFNISVGDRLVGGPLFGTSQQQFYLMTPNANPSLTHLFLIHFHIVVFLVENFDNVNT